MYQQEAQLSLGCGRPDRTGCHWPGLRSVLGCDRHQDTKTPRQTPRQNYHS